MKKLSTLCFGFTLATLFFVNGSIHAQKKIKITNLVTTGAIVLNDTTDFQPTISLDSVGIPADVYGDLFYLYQTDSMIEAGVPPRVIGLDGINQWVFDGMIDNVPVDIRPDEMRSNTPANLIILWPCMITNDSIISDSTTISLILDQLNQNSENLIYPNPVEQLMYITPEEIPGLFHVRVISQSTGVSTTYSPNVFAETGYIDMSEYPTGWYTVELKYTGPPVTSKYVVVYKL